jgi:hypothetical protein
MNNKPCIHYIHNNKSEKPLQTLFGFATRETPFCKHFVNNHITIFFYMALNKKSLGFDTWVVGG